MPSVRRHGDGVRVGERGGPFDELDPMPVQVLLDPEPLDRGDGELVAHEVADRHLVLEGDVQARQVAVAVPREEQRRLAQGLRRQRAGVGGGPADDALPLDQGDLLAEVRRLRSPFLARRARADDDQVELLAVHGFWSSPLCCRSSSL